jgi:Neutral/alkaline non-lysosomal ceramidase, N-terminal
MKNSAMFRFLAALALFTFGSAAPLTAAEFRAGTASAKITPKIPLMMAGYASRTKPCETTNHELYVKALALQSGSGKPFVLLTSDLCGIPRSLSTAVCAAVEKKTGIPRAQLLLSCSHTHCGPVVRDNLFDMYDMPADQPAKIAAYTEMLRDAMIDTMVRAVADLQPATLATGFGTARFAMNRREAKGKGISIGSNPEGPVDHDVPVLKIVDAAGKLKAVVFGYACHNTTLSFFEWCGDYAGFAQIEIEKKHPGALAMFWIGCGADANPMPRGKLEHAQQYGKELAIAVAEMLPKTTPLTAAPEARYSEIALSYDTIPGRAAWEAEAAATTFAVKQRAKKMLAILDAGKAIPTEYPHYPVQVWKFGDQLTWVALGGEVVIDYNRRIKKELPGTNVWIAGYTNDVVAYIPSVRILKEGGYEADSSQIYYGQPARWAPTIEEAIVAKVKELAK